MAEFLATQIIEREKSEARRSSVRRLREALQEAMVFTRSRERTWRFSYHLQLNYMVLEQIKRLGNSAVADASQFDPYGLNPADPPPASETWYAVERFTTISGADKDSPTRYERVVALENAMNTVIEELRSDSPIVAAEYGPSFESAGG